MGAYDVIADLCKQNGLAITKLESNLGFGRGSIGKLRNGKTSADRLQKIADYFGVSVEYLLTGEEPPEMPNYYLNDDARQAAQFLFENPEYKVLFDASRKVKKEDIEIVKALLDRFSE